MNPKIKIYRDLHAQWRWSWHAKNGHILADSGQGYADKRDCIRGLERVTGGWVEITFGQGSNYQQGTLTRWDGPRWGDRPAPFLSTTFVEVVGERLVKVDRPGLPDPASLR